MQCKFRYKRENEKDFRFMHCNARRRPVVNKLVELELCIMNEKPDVVAITETWLTHNISDNELHFEGYTLFRRDRDDPIKQRGGGVLMYIRSSLNPFEVIDVKSDLFSEIIFCNISCKGENTLLGVCYRPPDSKVENDESFYKILSSFKNKAFILLGDLNLANLKWDNKTCLDKSHPFVECLDNNFISQCVDKPSRGDNFLDLILCSDETLIKNLSVDEPFETSDHQIIRFEIVGVTCNKDKKFPVYDYFKGDYDVIRQHVQTLGWGALKTSNCVNEIWSKLKADILDIRDRFINIKGRPISKAKWGRLLQKREK